ncbi:MAG: hypothetical protein A3I11_07540 [Elusimicrobia bacterium RIFCSPLOWO2_02_FULL_39_32]|nr:MAG: hypothetical protein A2034_06610 [Elusimicrobia bacterium GWA2_38_7]OGR81395.1 MAG: hypothetical protein A3B80_05085 [Elusimicrobia bacterium RIFCSPHIGHO2_02_FULL_39_36]OGR92038.1 MAG: hypothetical protein A3I11_07540 [Elusimicrobia bacterium RIFCSPLOWO2_02_FULL_39_32]OGR98671.1 MAG: hypothetical protein A3G85_04890 [Elusimicrobia bacterium RIFCSPLOWO2_12_FULL_39_28]
MDLMSLKLFLLGSEPSGSLSYLFGKRKKVSNEQVPSNNNFKPISFILVILFLFFVQHLGFAKEDFSSIVGTYRCWKYNVGGAGKRCTSPPLKIYADGTYQMSVEKGTVKMLKEKGKVKIVLSQSKIRGPGTLLEGNQILFEYTYNGWEHSVTYLKTEE